MARFNSPEWFPARATGLVCSGLLLLWLAGCDQVRSQPTLSAPQPPAAITVATPVPAAPASAPGDTPTVVPTAAITVSAASAADWTQTAAVDGDFFVLGNPAAPLRLVDYSDFL
jgi:hypothetical protein